MQRLYAFNTVNAAGADLQSVPLSSNLKQPLKLAEL
jgi:hypothetical protein